MVVIVVVILGGFGVFEKRNGFVFWWRYLIVFFGFVM